MLRCALLCLSLLLPSVGVAQLNAEVLWDAWGVPHVYAGDRESTLYALGWAQMHAHGALISELYAAARGHAASLHGESAYRDDVLVHQLNLPERARLALQKQEPRYRAQLEAFVRGLNDYAKRHPEVLTSAQRTVLPFTATDVLAHVERVMLTRFLFTDRAAIEGASKRERSGSNGYAIAPSRSASGHAMLVINPHLPWSGELTQFEAQVALGDHFFYGSMLVGQPYFAMGFSDALGWTHTVNWFDALDTYELTLRDGGYALDGSVRAFEERPPVSVKVRGQRARSVRVLSSEHGPVVFLDEAAGRALAVRFSAGGLDQVMRRYWQLADAHGVAEFEAIANRDRLPCFNTLYADQHGDILFRYEGVMPRRNGGDYASWQGIVRGDQSANLWRDVYGLEAMPRVLNPASGFVQNANDPPWYASLPPLAVDAYPPFIALPELDYRAQQSLRRVSGDPSIGFDELVAMKQSNRVELADRFLPALLDATEGQADLEPARRVLAAWDRTLSAKAAGAVLFLAWADEMRAADSWQREAWSAREPLDTPRGIADPELARRALRNASKLVKRRYGRLQVTYGSVYRLRLGKYDLPASTGSSDYGLYSAAEFMPGADGKHEAWGGDTFAAIVEFTQPMRAVGLLSYGNASRKGSKHIGDQLALFSRRELRPLWLTRSEVEQHIQVREALTAPALEATKQE